MKGLFYRIGFNTIIQVLGKIISIILSLISVGFLTRYLGREGFGNYTLIFTYFAFFGIIADLGLQLTMVRELVKKKSLLKEIYGTYFWLKLFLVILSTLLAILFLLFLPYPIFLKIGIMIASLGVFIGLLNNFGMVIFQANIRLDLVTLVDTVSKIITILFIVLFIRLKLDFYSILLTVFIGNLGGTIIIIYLLKKFILLSFDFNFDLAKSLLKKTLPVALISIFTLLYFKIDTLILSVFKGPAEVGIYGLAYKVIENILVLWGFYIASVYPLLSGFWFKKMNREAYNLWWKSILIAILSSGTIVFFGYVFAPFFIRILGGEEFQESIISLRILLFSVPLFFINNLFFHSFLAKEKNNLLLLAIIMSLVLNIILNLVFIPQWGFMAASVNTVVTEIFLFIIYSSTALALKLKSKRIL